MNATFVDLRTKSSEILEALERNESITILYRGHAKAVMQPIAETRRSTGNAKDHAAFGLWEDADERRDVSALVRELRRGRFNAR